TMGLGIPSDAIDVLPDERQADDDIILRAIEVIETQDKRRAPGAILWLGMLGHRPCVPDLLDVLRDPPSEEIETAAIIALGWIGEGSAEAISLLESRFDTPKGEQHVLNALNRFNLPESRRAMLNHATRRRNADLAAHLAGFPD